MSTADIKKGRALTVQYNSTKVGDVMSIALSVSGNPIDVSNWDTGDWTEYIAGRKGWTMSITAHNTEATTDTNQAAVIEDLFSDTSGTISFGPETPSTGDVTYSGDVIISSFSVDAGDSDEPIEISLEFQGTGALTRSIQAV